MAFDAKDLRIQLPCGPITVFPCRLGTCRLPTRFCGYPTLVTCPWLSCKWGTGCGYFSGCGPSYCDFSHWNPLEEACIGSEPLTPVTVIGIEELEVLREQLEVQLKEIQVAQNAVRKFEKGSK